MEDGTEDPASGHIQALIAAGEPTRFAPGVGGNPTGLSKYELSLREAIRRQESPKRVCDVVHAMYLQACSGGKSAPAAAKAYFAVVGAETNDAERIVKGVAAHLDELMREAERLEAVERERAALNPKEGT